MFYAYLKRKLGKTEKIEFEKTVDFDKIQLQGYHPFIYNKTETHFGGTGIYVLDKYSFQKRNDLDITYLGNVKHPLLS